LVLPGVVGHSAVLADGLWYQLGRKKGISVLQFLCRISLEPILCVRRTEGVFAKTRCAFPLVAKFVPGLSTAAPPSPESFTCAGGDFCFGMRLARCSGPGAFLLTGYISADRLKKLRSVRRSLAAGDVLIVGRARRLRYVKFIAGKNFWRECVSDGLRRKN